jgi:hypothetical protein
MTEPKPTYQTCEHSAAVVMADHGPVTLLECDWGCGQTLINVTDENGISYQFTAAELLTIASQAGTFKGQVIEYENTWLAINREIALLEDFMEKDDTWENADLEDLYQFDPWACLRKSLEFMKEARRLNAQRGEK